MRSPCLLPTAALFLIVLAAPVPAQAQFKAGPEFRVNTYTTNNQWYPSIAVARDGEFVVVWNSRSQDGYSYGVFGRAFRDDGSPLGSEFRANTYTTFEQLVAGVAHDGNEFVVVWTSDFQDGSGEGVFARRFRKDGTPEGDELQVNAFTTGDQRAWAVAKDRREGSRGGFVVVWTDYAQDYAGNVRARRFDANGDPLTGEIPVNVYTTSQQTAGEVAMTDDGRFVVVWSSYGQDGYRFGVFGRRFAADGSPLGGEFQVNSARFGFQFPGGVAMAGDARFVVAFQQPDGDAGGVFARRFDAGGNAIGLEFQVNKFTTGIQAGPSVAVNERGDFVVTWGEIEESSADVFAQRFDRDGARVGAEFQVNAYTTGPQGLPRVAADQVGNFVAAWTSDAQDGSGSGIYAQRFGGILFTALALDRNGTVAAGGPLASDGNGVLEPGEVVVVEPSWKNVSGVAQTLTGHAGSFTGPAGPTYALPDPNAGFGTIPDGASQSCTVTNDCYVLGVSGARPATHWDGVMEEGPTDSVLGQVKLWKIHVGDSFADVPRGSPFYRFVETVLHHGVTGGCGSVEYCPQASTTREQMAVFVTRAASGPLFTPRDCGAVPLFADVPASSAFCRWIEDLARRGVVSGCGGGNYCPSDPVSREQMAVFVLRALDPAPDPPACTTPMFADVPASSPFCRWIEELARRGVVTGCGGGNYCPTAPVTREQMSVFISATFGLTLYGP